MKRYKYIIVSNDEGTRTELADNPIGWEDVKFSVIRDLVYFGVFKSISAEFDFVGDGYKTLQKLYLKYGVDADALLIIYDQNEFFFDAKINFVNFQDDRKLSKIRIDLIQSSFVQNFQNREDVQLNLLATQTLDLTAINPITSYTATIRGKQLLLYSEFLSTIYTTLPPDFQIYNHIVPFELVKNDNPNVKQSFAIDTTDAPTGSLYQSVNGFYTNLTTTEQTFDIVFDFDIAIVFLGSAKLIPDNGDRLFNNVVRYQIHKIDAGGTSLGAIYTQQYEEVTGVFNLSGSYTVTLQPEESLVFVCLRLRSASGDPYDFLSTNQMAGTGIGASYETNIYYISRSLTIQDNSVFADSECPMYLPHEVFNQLIALITGKENAVTSNYYGRTDIGYDVDGAGSLCGITNGYLLRGATEGENELKMSFRDCFESYNCLDNLGILITGETISIEPKEDLINYQIAANIGEVSNVVVSPAKEFIYNSVKAGFPYIEYEETNGTDEFNTTVQYTNSIKSVKNELNIMSKWRGDGYGIEFTRRKSLVTTGTQDTKADRDIFFIDLVRDGDDLISRRLEGISGVSGILNPSTAMNLRISPAQNLLNFDRLLAISLSRKVQQEYFFQSKDKNNNLSVTTPKGVTTDRENLILLNPPYFIPEYREFSAPLTAAMLPDILANPLGLIQYTYLGESFYDFLFEIEGEKEKSLGNWKVMATKPIPVSVTGTDGDVPNSILYDDAFDSNILYGNSQDNIILYE